MGVFKLGFVTIYLADPLISGFTTGAACHVFTSQVKYVLGIKVLRFNGALKLIKVCFTITEILCLDNEINKKTPCERFGVVVFIMNLIAVCIG